MKQSVKWVALVCSAALLLLALAGCGQKTETPANSSATGNQQVKEKPVVLRFSWWGSDERHQATLAAIDAYQKLNPHVTIEGEYQGYEGYQKKLMTQLAGNSAPDLIQFDNTWLQDFAAQGDNFIDYNEHKDLVDLTSFDEKILIGYCSIDGKLLGLPMGGSATGTVLNKPFFEKYGLALDTQWSWDKIVEEGKRIHELDPNTYLLAIDVNKTLLHDNFVMAYLLSKYGKYWINDDLVIQATESELIDMFAMERMLFSTGAVMPLEEAALFDSKLEQSPRFLNNQIGIVTFGAGFIPRIKSVQKPENLAVGPNIFAMDAKDKTVRFKPSMEIGVNKKSQHAEEAIKFANWIVNDQEAAKIVTDVRSTPTSKIALKTLEEAHKLDPDIVSIVNSGLQNPSAPVPLILYNPEILEIVGDVAQKVGYGKITPEQAAGELLKRVQDKLNELK